jgi:hypothetical protein
MKIDELLAVVDEGWIRKPKGFRVRFQTRSGSGWVTDIMPGANENLLDSDVTAWRAAWKLWQTAKSGHAEYVNITVIDDRGELFPSYISGRTEVFNPRPEAADAPPTAAQASSEPGKEEVFVDALPSAEEDEEATQHR